MGVGYYLLDEEHLRSPRKTFSRSPPIRLSKCGDGDTFKIDLPGMHALFGDNLSIRVLGIDTPEMKGTSDQIKALAIRLVR